MSVSTAEKLLKNAETRIDIVGLRDGKVEGMPEGRLKVEARKEVADFQVQVLEAVNMAETAYDEACERQRAFTTSLQLVCMQEAVE